MDEKRLSKLINKLYTRLPIAGVDFRIKAVKELVRDGSEEAVTALEEAVSRSTNLQIQQLALDGLSTLAHEGCEGPAQEALCRLVTEKGNLIARDIAVANGYIPKELHQRVLFFFFTEQWDKYEKIDIGNRFIKSIYESADDTTRKRIMFTARRAGRIEWASAAIGGRKGIRLSEMTEEEWNAVISILEYSKKWHELWLLAQKGPPFFSLKIIHKLKHSGWTPLHGDVYKKLIQIADQLDEELPALTSIAWPLLKENADCVVTLSMSPDGRMFAKWGEESAVCLWSRSKNITVDKPEMGFAIGRPISVSAKGEIFAIASYEVFLWTKPYCRPLCRLSSPDHHVRSAVMAMTPDEKFLAMDEFAGISLWSLPDGKLLNTIGWEVSHVYWHRGDVSERHIVFPDALAITPDGNILASGSKKNNKVTLWDLLDGKLLNTLEGHSLSVNALAISPDGQLLVSGGTGYETCIWSLPDGKLLNTLKDHFVDVPERPTVTEALAISPDGQLLVSVNLSDRYRVINLWSLPDGKLLKTLIEDSNTLRPLYNLRNINISTDGRILASITDKTVHLWSLPEGRLVRILKLPKGFILSLLINPGIKMLTYLSSDRTIRFWDTNLILMIPVIQMTLQDIRSIEEASKIDDVSEVEKNWLEFVLELVLSNRQFDILIEEIAYPIETEEFDIVID